jgi:hypothetical protein
MTELKVLVLCLFMTLQISLLLLKHFGSYAKHFLIRVFWEGTNRVTNIRRKDARNLLLRNRMELCLLLGVKSLLLL